MDKDHNICNIAAANKSLSAREIGMHSMHCLHYGGSVRSQDLNLISSIKVCVSMNLLQMDKSGTENYEIVSLMALSRCSDH